MKSAFAMRSVSAREPRVRGPCGDRDRDDRVDDARPERRREREREHDLRERERDVGDPHERAVDEAAAVAGRRADREPDRHDDRDDEDRDAEREPRARDQTREDVAAELVGAEPVRRGAGRQQPVGEHLAQRVVRHDERRDERDRDERGEDREPEKVQRIAGEAAPAAVREAERRLPARGGRVGQQPRAQRRRGGIRAGVIG